MVYNDVQAQEIEKADPGSQSTWARGLSILSRTTRDQSQAKGGWSCTHLILLLSPRVIKTSIA